MGIIQSEIKFYRSTTVNDGSTNGGRISASQISSGAAANLLDAVQNAERVAGSTKYRKLFAKVANDADAVLVSARVFLDKYTLGDDIITFFPGTQRDAQSAITGSEDQYGAGKLDGNVSDGATEIDVLVEDGAVVIFRVGDVVRISDKADIDASGNEEFVTLSDVDIVDDVATLTFSPALENSYLASNTRVASVYEHGDVEPLIDNFVVTTAGDGDFNSANLLGDSIGGIEQTWTLTWTGATSFTVVGDTVGSLGSFSNGAGASPNNPSFSKPYFVLQSAGFSGTWAAADTIVFQTHPAAVPVWMKRVTPAGASAALSNSATLVLDGETE